MTVQTHSLVESGLKSTMIKGAGLKKLTKRDERTYANENFTTFKVI